LHSEIPWINVNIPVEQGHHIIEWRYERDSSVTGNNDRVWLDNIILPPAGIPESAVLSLDQQTINITAEEGSTDLFDLHLSNLGEENLQWSVSRYYQNSRDYGGPDEYGYMWMDSKEDYVVEFDWIDISDSGISVVFVDNDTGTDMIPLSFTFNFYGSDYEEFRINPNGWIGFADDNQEWSNTDLPNRDAPRPAIMPFWDDLHPQIESSGSGTVYYQNFDDYLIVMFNNVIHFQGDYNGTYDFEVIISENGRIKMQYHTLEGDLDTCTIGIQKYNFSDGLQILYNDVYLEEDLAIEIKQVVDWLSISPASGVVPGYVQQNLQLTASSANLEIGQYSCDLIFHSSDPLQQLVIVPVIFNVEESIIDIGNEICPVNKLECIYPNPFNPETTIKYEISAAGNVKLEVYNIKGQKVNMLMNEYKEPGNHSLHWNADKFNSGVYFLRFSSGGYRQTKKVLLLK